LACLTENGDVWPKLKSAGPRIEKYLGFWKTVETLKMEGKP